MANKIENELWHIFMKEFIYNQCFSLFCLMKLKRTDYFCFYHMSMNHNFFHGKSMFLHCVCQKLRGSVICDVFMEIAILSFTGNCNHLKGIVTSFRIKGILEIKNIFFSFITSWNNGCFNNCGLILLTTCLDTLQILGGSRFHTKIIGAAALRSNLWGDNSDGPKELKRLSFIIHYTWWNYKCIHGHISVSIWEEIVNMSKLMVFTVISLESKLISHLSTYDDNKFLSCFENIHLSWIKRCFSQIFCW